MRRSLVLMLLSILAGSLFGLGMSSIPSPHDVAIFWVGNFCAPWLVLAFLAGRAQRSWRLSALAGVATEIACVTGFYARFLTLDTVRLGLPKSTPTMTVAEISVSRWLYFIAPWIVAGVAAGLVYGVFGFLWHRSRPLVAGLAVALPFFVEPVLWPIRNGHYQGPWGVWATEVSVGLLFLGFVLTLRRSSSFSALSSLPTCSCRS